MGNLYHLNSKIPECEEGEKVMTLSVKINKKTKQAFVTDIENGNTWSKKELEYVIGIIEKNNAISEYGDTYLALKDAYSAIISAENIMNSKGE